MNDSAVRFCRYEAEVFPGAEFYPTKDGGLVHVPQVGDPHTVMGDDLDGEEWELTLLGPQGEPVTPDRVGKWVATVAAAVIVALVLAAIVLLFAKGAVWFWNL